MATASSYAIALVNDGNGVWTPTVRRNPTAPSGGTAVTLPWIDNNNSGANTTTTLIFSGLEACLRGIMNDESTNASTPSTFSYSAYMSNNGSGTFTPTVKRNPTQASGGTVVTLPWVGNQSLGSSTPNTSKHVDVAFRAAMRGVLNDVASGN